jgi:hypothetical protein
MPVVPINVGRPRSVRLVEDLLGRERALVGVVSQRSADIDEPTFNVDFAKATTGRHFTALLFSRSRARRRAAPRSSALAPCSIARESR